MKSPDASEKKILITGAVLLVIINFAVFLILKRSTDNKKAS
ncbi:hypothetical protein ACHAL6_02780 [Proteiniclasticum sp. C24MP]